MNKHETWAWRFSIIYTIIALCFISINPFSTIACAFQLVLLGIFYLGFKKQQWFFTSLGCGYLFFGSMKAIYRLFTQILPHSRDDGFTALILGALASLIFMLLLTYFALRAFADQMIHRFGKR